MITQRTECILQNVTKKSVADIGTDHAYIPIALIKRGICSKVIASDIRTGPVEIAKGNILKHGLSNKIEVRKGNGLECIEPGECEQAIIAGMGGALISNILSQCTDFNMSFVLQPMNCQYELRKYLLNNGYAISKEDIAIEGFKVYNVICAHKGRADNDMKKDIDYHLPPKLYGHKYFSSLKDKKRREFLKILNGNKRSVEPDMDIVQKYEELLKELEILN